MTLMKGYFGNFGVAINDTFVTLIHTHRTIYVYNVREFMNVYKLRMFYIKRRYTENGGNK